MTFCRSAVLVCLVTGLISPLGSQDNAKVALPNPPPVAKVVTVDLCALADQMGTKDQSKPRIQLEGPKDHKFSLAAHDDFSLRVGDQIAWTCSTKKFVITKIQKVWKPDVATNCAPPDSAKFPFGSTKAPYLGVVQPAGSQLLSGVALPTAVNQWYAFEFRLIAGPKIAVHDSPAIDPHFIVTGDPGTGGKGDGTHHPCPHPDPSPTPAKPAVKSKQ